MARIRTVKPEYWSDETVGSLSLPARLLFPATWNFADDEGLVNWSATFLKASIFPYDYAVSIEDVAGWMKEIEDAGFVHVYSTSRAKHRVAFVINFREHQRIDKPQPAKSPVPNWRDPGVVMVFARRDDFICAQCKAPTNEEFARDADGRRYDPICQRIKSPTERKVGPDDPTNVEVVHVMCAKDFDPNEPLMPIPGPFGDRSQNVPGMVQERSRDLVSPDSPSMRLVAEGDGEATEEARETAGQSVPRTFLERSQPEGKGRDQGKEGIENLSAADGGLFPEPERIEKPHADKPRASDEPTAQTFIREWLDGCTQDDQPTGRIIGRVGKEIKALIAEGARPEDIRQGLTDWDAKGGGSPTALPAFVNGARSRRRQVEQGRTQGSGIPAQRLSPVDQRFADAIAAGERLEAMAQANGGSLAAPQDPRLAQVLPFPHKEIAS